jgi:hypothetical protein
LDEYSDVFPDQIPEELPPMREVNHHIRLRDPSNLKNQPTYSIPDAYKSPLCDWINQQQRRGVIYRAEAPGAAPMFVQPKADGKRIRPLVDLKLRNENTVMDSSAIPNQTQILNAVGRARFRSKIDLSDAYFQTRLDPESERYNSFKTPFGSFISRVMLQGDMNAPATFM